MDWKDIAIEECEKGKAALQAGANIWSRDITEGERRLLAAAAELPDYLLVDGRRAYPAIEVGGDAVEGELSDFEMATDWEDFCSLCRRGVVDHVMNSRFRLTEAGKVHAELTKAKCMATFSIWRERASREDDAAAG